MKSYILVSQHVRHQALFERLQSTLVGDWHFITQKEQFNIERLIEINPQYIFMPHWSYKIPLSITEAFTCIMFHMTDLPFGRGGSPLQNLIVRGFKETKLSAFRCNEQLDSGPIYAKLPLSLTGSAREIFSRADRLVSQLIFDIIQQNIEPEDQVGEVIEFQRRTPAQGDISLLTELSDVYDYIRMLDADGYPNAFLDVGALSLTFSHAKYDGQQITAQVVFKEKIDVK